MLRRFLCALSAAAVLGTGGGSQVGTETRSILQMLERHVILTAEARSGEAAAPSTGEHPAPIIAAMGLAFTGVALSLIIDEQGKKH